jgi:enamine deaminase RidA (YjgF/YER057c/UK114 family)
MGPIATETRLEEAPMRLPVSFFVLFLSFPALAGSPSPEQRLAELGHVLPPPSTPVATYRTAVRSGNLLFLSGHGECGQPFTTGKVGRDLTVEQGAASAERVALCMLSTIKNAVGDLSRVNRFLRVLGMVNATEDFTDHPKVINGFSNLMVAVFGDDALAARAAVGMQSLPSDIAVEIEAIVELRDD